MKRLRKIAIGCDHTGIDLKAPVLEVLSRKWGWITRISARLTTRAWIIRYTARRPPMPWQAASARCGIIMCGTGQGIGMTANKVHGVRCCICSEPYSAQMGREHNDANMLAMGARVVGSELAKMIVRTFLTSSFLGERHARRVAQINAVDEQR